MERIVSSLQTGKIIAVDERPKPLLALSAPSVQPYLISYFKYDPRIEIAKIKSATTIVQGTHDVQVPIENGKALAAAQPAASFVMIDGMTHVLSEDAGTTLAEQIGGAYADASRPIDATLVRRLVTMETT